MENYEGSGEEELYGEYYYEYWSANTGMANWTDLLDQRSFYDNQRSIVRMSKFCMAIAVTVCCLVGFYGNTMSSLIFLSSSMRSPINTLLAAVSVIDLSLLLLVIPVLILPGLDLLIQSHFLKSCYALSILYIYPIGVMSRTASMWTYVVVGVERYIAVCQPLQSHKLLTNRRAKCALFFIILISVLYNIVRFWEYRWNAETNRLESYLHEDPIYFLFYYTSLHMITHYLLPIAIILILHASIVLNLKQARDGRAVLTMRRSGSAGNDGCNAADRRQNKTTLMIVVATGVFVACNSLSFLVNLWETIDPSGLENEKWSTFVHVMTDMANLLLALHSACSFLIYMKFCRQYRQLFRGLMRLPPDTEDPPVDVAVLSRDRRQRWLAVRRRRTMVNRSSREEKLMAGTSRMKLSSELTWLGRTEYSSKV